MDKTPTTTITIEITIAVTGLFIKVSAIIRLYLEKNQLFPFTIINAFKLIA
jgi:hypothetical protein